MVLNVYRKPEGLLGAGRRGEWGYGGEGRGGNDSSAYVRKEGEGVQK